MEGIKSIQFVYEIAVSDYQLKIATYYKLYYINLTVNHKAENYKTYKKDIEKEIKAYHYKKSTNHKKVAKRKKGTKDLQNRK